MGGKSQGDVASQEVVADIEAWFYHEDVGILSEIDGVSAILDKRIQNINKNLNKNSDEDTREIQSDSRLKIL